MVNFGQGYFDRNGKPNYRHTDWQGSVTMVTDKNGELIQHTGYYPYGEPWREPEGQPYLFGGKERMRENGTAEYDFSARRYYSAIALWTTPDPKALDFANVSPYAYCSGNPIKYVDPSGCATFHMYNGKEIIEVGTDGIDDGRIFLVNEDLGKQMQEAKNNDPSYIYSG